MESRRYFCDDFIRDILIRLPTKSLLRFKSLSKSWSSSISDPCFRSNSPKIIISESHLDWLSSDLWSSPSNLEKLDLPVELDRHNKSHRLELVGSCNGLLLLTTWNDHLWILNASTREYCSIDVTPNIRYPGSCCTRYQKYNNYGFGYDSVNDDYKVIRIFSYRQNRDKLVRATFVYSLRNNTWRQARAGKGSLDPGSSTIIQGPGVLVGGKLHWFAFHGRYIDSCRYILAFDVSNEYFEELSAGLPKGEGANSCFGFLTELGGCLGIAELTKGSSSAVAVWVLKEFGWVRVFKTRDGDFKYKNPLAYSKNGDEVMMCNCLSCVWYNKENGKVEELFSLGNGRAIKITMCLDTLVSISAYRSHEEEKEQSRKRRRETCVMSNPEAETNPSPSAEVKFRQGKGEDI